MESLPIRLIFAVWAEISDRGLRESLPIRPISPHLGRDFRAGAAGISTYSADFCCLGRDFQPGAARISTYSADFPHLGRDLQPGAAGTPSHIIYNDTYENRALWTKVRKLKKIFIAITPGIQ